MAVVREFLEDRLVNLVGKHGRLAIAWMRGNLDGLCSSLIFGFLRRFSTLFMGSRNTFAAFGSNAK
jgi:hypothetical protein